MTTLVDYVMSHTERGECKCGKCLDVGNRPDPTGHTADLIFFQMVAVAEPSQGELLKLIDHHRGEFAKVNVLDGKEHGYIELGGWIGNQEAALRFMGLGHIVGLFKLLTPNLLPDLPDDLKMQMAGSGMVSIQYESASKKKDTSCETA